MRIMVDLVRCQGYAQCVFAAPPSHAWRRSAYCFGAPLSRLETPMALGELVCRLEKPHLVVDPPPYRMNPLLRGPRQLLIEFAGISA